MESDERIIIAQLVHDHQQQQVGLNPPGNSFMTNYESISGQTTSFPAATNTNARDRTVSQTTLQEDRNSVGSEKPRKMPHNKRSDQSVPLQLKYMIRDKSTNSKKTHNRIKEIQAKGQAVPLTNSNEKKSR